MHTAEAEQGRRLRFETQNVDERSLPASLIEESYQLCGLEDWYNSITFNMSKSDAPGKSPGRIHQSITTRLSA